MEDDTNYYCNHHPTIVHAQSEHSAAIAAPFDCLFILYFILSLEKIISSIQYLK